MQFLLFVMDLWWALTKIWPTFAPIPGEDLFLSSPVFWQNIAIYRHIPTAFFGTAALSATHLQGIRRVFLVFSLLPLLINPTKIKGPYHLRSRFFGETGSVVVLEVLVILQCILL